MKTPIKKELQQTAFNHSADTGFRDYANLVCSTNVAQRNILF